GTLTLTYKVVTLSAKTPSISGTAKVDEVLTAKVSAWGPAPVELAYQWKANGKNIEGAVASTYKVAAGDVGKKITVSVTGSKDGYKAVSKTSKSKKAAKASLKTYTPVISGTAQVDNTVQVSVSPWQAAKADDTSVALAYQWYRSGKAIKGATKDSYTLVGADAGKKLTVKVTGSKAGYSTASKTSKSVKVAKGVLGVDPEQLQVAGTLGVGNTLSVERGVWSAGVAPKVQVQWYRAGKAIKGAVNDSYTLVSGDVGKEISVKVTGSATGYTTKVLSNSWLWPYQQVGQLSLVAPAAGYVVGQTVKVSSVGWQPVPSLKYQWYRDGKAISKATKSSYKLAKADAGKQITVKVTISKSGYTAQPAWTSPAVTPTT
ncbi:MAG: hypothetical protein LBR58_05605, partial [Propionibacteriaceae bacterium]|nr:hypothetical protein [Propionibacteriaceae bacterium]